MSTPDAVAVVALRRPAADFAAVGAAVQAYCHAAGVLAATAAACAPAGAAAHAIAVVCKLQGLDRPAAGCADKPGVQEAACC